MLIALDHIALAVRDLSSAADRYSALLGCAPRWHAADSGAEHARIQLGNIALDIVAPTGPGSTGDRIRMQLDQHGEGIWAIAFATGDVDAARKILSRRAINSMEPQRRVATSVDGKTQLAMHAAELAANATYGPTIFIVAQASEATARDQSTSTCAHTAVSGLDHVVITTAQPERAAALYGARLGLEMKLDRTNPDWGSRLMFFRCGDLIVEVAHSLKASEVNAPDRIWGLSWRVGDIAAARRHIVQAGFNVSDVRAGRKPGTQVFTVRDAPASVPTLVIGKVAGVAD